MRYQPWFNFNKKHPEGLRYPHERIEKLARTAWKYRRAARKAEQERDEILKAAIDFAGHLRMWKIIPDDDPVEIRARNFLDKHKEIL